MGEFTALQGITTIAELAVAIDLALDAAQPLNKLAISSLANKWWIDRITLNAAVLISAKGRKLFIKNPDGSFTAPIDFPATLTFAAGVYTLTTPQGMVSNFNSSGQISSIVMPNGVTVSFSYSSGLLSTVSNGMGRTLTLAYSAGRVSSVSDGTGRSVSFTYDGSGNLSSAIDTLSRSVTYEYDQPGRMTKCFLPANPTVPVVTNVYDSLGRVQTQQNALSQTLTYYFAGSRTEEVNPLGNARILYFNKYGSPVRTINALGKKSFSKYDGRNRLIEFTAPEGNKVQYSYDRNNNVLTQTFVAKPGSGLSNIQRVFTYHPTWAKVASASDGNGNVTNFSYDPATGNLLSATGPAVAGISSTVAYTYNTRGQISTLTDPTGIVTKLNYDVSTERLLSVVKDYSTGGGHLNLTTSFGYDPVGNVTSVTDPRGNTTTASYDNQRRLTQTVSASPFSFVQNFSYDFNGRLTSVARQIPGDPNWQTAACAYSLTDKLSSLTDSIGRVTVFTYDGNDRLQSTLDPENRLTQFSYDVLDRFISVIDPSSTTAQTRTYSDNGLVNSLRDANSNQTLYEYDGFDRPQKATYPDSTTTQITSYDANGNPLTLLNRAGNSTTLTYDALSRLSTKQAFGLPTISYAYDLAGRLTSVSKPVVVGDPSTGVFQTFFDSAGRYFKEQYPDGKAVVHELDSNGNRTKTTWPDGYFVTRSFDQLNRLEKIFLNGSATPSVSYAYDQLSRLTSVSYDNGTSSSYAFELNNDLVAMAHNFVGSAVSYTFGYNAVHELIATGLTDPTFHWHPQASGTVAYGMADVVNRYPTVGGNAYSYDANLNLTADGTWTFAYDSENRLLSANKAGTAASFKYDPVNRQAQKTVNSVSTRFVYDGTRLIATYDGSGNLLDRYVHGLGVDQPCIQVSSAGVRTYSHFDRQGSVVALTNASGVIQNRITYSPYGESANLAGAIFGYTGQRFDSETGLYYYKNRYYAPAIGRFLQPDPIGYAAGDMNLYAYVANNPMNFRDPYGLQSDYVPNFDDGDYIKILAEKETMKLTGGVTYDEPPPAHLPPPDWAPGNGGGNMGNQFDSFGSPSLQGQAMPDPFVDQLLIMPFFGLGRAALLGLKGLFSKEFWTVETGSGSLEGGLWGFTRRAGENRPAPSFPNQTAATTDSLLSGNRELMEKVAQRQFVFFEQAKGAEGLARQFGGSPEQWYKFMTTGARITETNMTQMIHGFMNIETGQVVFIKTVIGGRP